MDKKRNVPEIRFKGFEEEWEIEKGKNLFSISTGKSNTQDKVENGQYPFYVRSFIIEHSNKFLFDEEAVLTVGDGVGTGKVFHYVNGKYDLHQRVYRMFNFNEKINGLYFYYYFSNNFYNRVMAMSAKTSVDSVRYNMISEMSIELPKIKEQFKIANYLKNIDQKLEIERKKHQKLINFKKAMLENMFPKEGENVPKIRFSGFSDEWGDKRLGDITSYLNGSGNEKEQLTTGKYEIINLNSISIDGGLKSSGKYVNNALNTLLKNDLVMVLSDLAHGDLLGRVAIIPDDNKFVLNQRVALLRIAKKIQPYFLFSSINNNQSYFKVRGAGSSQKNISRGVVEDFICKIPSFEEQTLIGSFFQNLDKKIELLAKKIKKIEDFKKAMLEKMFV